MQTPEDALMVPDEPIRLGGAMPGVLRGVLVTVGLVACALIVHDLGRPLLSSLWPLSPVSLFVGVIFFGGLTVGLAFALIGAFAPDEVWEITKGEIRITLKRGRHQFERRFTPQDFDDLRVIVDDSSDGPTTWHLSGRIRPDSPGLILFPHNEPTLVLLRFLDALRRPLAILRREPAYLDKLRSPGLTREDKATEALERFYSS